VFHTHKLGSLQPRAFWERDVPRTLVRVKHKLALVALVGVALALAVPAGAGAPASRLFEPGASLGGVRLGMTKLQVLRAWGARHGVCRECRRTTWYFNERPFRPEGTGVVFERGRVVHAFTVWQPRDWRTPEGLELAVAAGEIGATYGELTERRCPGYSALVREDAAASSVFYVYEDELWGFGLTRPGANPCP
jgi:hypothetical protein